MPPLYMDRIIDEEINAALEDSNSFPDSDCCFECSCLSICSRHGTKKVEKVSEAKWKELEQKSQDEQKEFLEKYFKKGMFKDEPVSSSNKNISRGDQIFRQGALGKLYDHHLLCMNVREDSMDIIEYRSTKIKKSTVTFKDLENKKAIVRTWPEELERYSPDEVISRAEFRVGERLYLPFDNNCEHFVTWCKCGLNTSLQVKPWYRVAWDGVKAVAGATFEGLKTYLINKDTALKVMGNLSDEIAGEISSSLSPIGFSLGAAIEIGFAAWYISQDKKKKENGIISETQFKVNTVTTLSKATGHVTGGTIGSALGGPFGSAIGGAIGYVVGHYVGSAVGSYYAQKVKEEPQERLAYSRETW